MKMLRPWLSALLLLASVTQVLGDNVTIQPDEANAGQAAQHQANQTNPRMCHPDMCAVLTELGAIKARLTAAEDHVQELNRENTALLVHLTVVTERLNNTNRKLGQLMSMNSTLTALQRKVAVQGLEIQALRYRSNFAEDGLRNHSILLDELGRAKPKVAFAAALGDGGQVGPSDVEQTLPFQKILTNIGTAYNPSTGVFVVPVSGVYYISYSTFTSGNAENNACTSLFRNDQRLLTACDHASAEDSTDSAGNGATLLLEKDDHVYVTLHRTSMVYDDQFNRSCFRGFLLFQM